MRFDSVILNSTKKGLKFNGHLKANNLKTYLLQALIFKMFFFPVVHPLVKLQNKQNKADQNFFKWRFACQNYCKNWFTSAR